MTAGEVLAKIQQMPLNSKTTFLGEHGQSVTVHKSINGSLFINGKAHFKSTALNEVLRIHPQTTKNPLLEIIFY